MTEIKDKLKTYNCNCTISDVHLAYKGRFYALTDLEYKDDSLGDDIFYEKYDDIFYDIYILNDAEKILIKDLSNNQYGLAYRAYNTCRELIDDFVVVKDPSKSWYEIADKVLDISLVYDYELADIEDVIDSIASTPNTQIAEKQVFIAQCYDSGCLTKTADKEGYIPECDKKSAMHWYQEATKNGSDYAQFTIGKKLYLNKKFDDTKAALNIFSGLSHKGYSNADCWEAFCLMRWKKYPAAQTCLIRAMKKNDDASHYAAYLFAEGLWHENWKSDDYDVRELYCRAAVNGIRPAMFRLGCILRDDEWERYRNRDEEYKRYGYKKERIEEIMDDVRETYMCNIKQIIDWINKYANKSLCCVWDGWGWDWDEDAYIYSRAEYWLRKSIERGYYDINKTHREALDYFNDKGDYYQGYGSWSCWSYHGDLIGPSDEAYYNDFWIDDDTDYYIGETRYEVYDDYGDWGSSSYTSGCGIGYSCDNCPNTGCHANSMCY